MFHWSIPEDDVPTWNVSLPPPDPAAAPLVFRPEFPEVGPLEVGLLDGGRFDLSEARGNVVLLDFWASWCSPCLTELPHLQALWERHARTGLVAIAVNAEEPEALARKTAAQLGLTLPIGLYNENLEERFRVRTLPTVIAIDRQGRLRARWDGYTDGLERDIDRRVESLLTRDAEGAPREIGRADPGRIVAEVVWLSEFPDAVGGVAVFLSSRGVPGVAVSAGPVLALMDENGRVVRRLRIPSDVHRIAPATPAASGEARVLAWREGGDRAVEIRPESEQLRAVLAPGVVWDLAEDGREGRGSSRIAWATPAGLFVSASDGASPERWGEDVPVRRVLPGPEGSDRSFLALDDRGQLRRLTAKGSSKGIQAAASHAGGLVAGSGAKIGVFGAPVVDAVHANLLNSSAAQVALAAVPDRLVIVDAESGLALWSATWMGVSDLHRGDLDGDGVDELVVAAGRQVAVLRFRSP